MSFEQVLGYLNYAATQGAIFIYLVVFISCIIENIFPPFPGDLIVLSGAFLAGRGSVNYVTLIVVSVAGGLVGAMMLYYFGKYKGRSFFEKYDKYYLKMENLHRIENWFERWGVWLLLFSRFVAGARSAIAVTAGIADVSVKRMAGLTLISFILWNGVLIGGMYLVKSNWEKLIGIIKSFDTALVIASAMLLLLWLVIIYRRSLVKK